MQIVISVSKSGLQVTVTCSFDTEPTSYTIRLLDNLGEEVSTVVDQALVATVPTSGVYKVLVVAFEGTTEYRNGMFILVEDPILQTNQFIITLVQQLMLDDLEIDYSEFINLREKWLTILSPNFNPPIFPTMDEAEMPFLYKLLIAHLIVRELILQIAQQYLTASAYSFLSSSSGTSGAGGIKKIVSGPIETEYFGDDDSSSVQQTLKTAFIPGGMFDNLLSAGCMLASHLDIYLSHCRVPSDSTYVPKILVLNDFY